MLQMIWYFRPSKGSGVVCYLHNTCSYYMISTNTYPQTTIELYRVFHRNIIEGDIKSVLNYSTLEFK